MRMVETGFITHWMILMTAGKNCTEPKYWSKQSIPLEDVTGSFIILFLGLSVAFITLIVEIIVGRGPGGPRGQWGERGTGGQLEAEGQRRT